MAENILRMKKSCGEKAHKDRPGRNQVVPVRGISTVMATSNMSYLLSSKLDSIQDGQRNEGRLGASCVFYWCSVELP